MRYAANAFARCVDCPPFLGLSGAAGDMDVPSPLLWVTRRRTRDRLVVLVFSLLILLLSVAAPLLLRRPPNSHRGDAVLTAARHSSQDV